MADQPDLSPEARDSSDEETIRGDAEGDQVADLLEEERQAAGTPVQPLGNGSLGNRYRLIVEASAGSESGTEGAASENGSVDAVPRRAGSPIDSLLSIPDDAPSVQVRASLDIHISDDERR